MAYDDIQDDELEMLAKRARQKFMANQFQEDTPESNLGLQLAAGGLDLLSKSAQDSQDIMSISTGIKGPNLRGASASDALQKALASKATLKRQQALDDTNSMSAIQKLVDSRREREDLKRKEERQQLERKQDFKTRGYDLGDDGSLTMIPGGVADLANRKALLDAENAPADRELNRLLKRAQLEAAEAKSNAGGGGGKVLPAGQAEAAGFARAASEALDDVNQLVDSNNSMMGPFSGRISELAGSMQIGETGKDAASVNATLKQRAQVIGKYLEGGKLTNEDILRYQEQLPKLSDSPEVAKNKVASLRTLLAQKQQAELDALQQAGYSTNQIPRINSPGVPGVARAPQQPGPKVGEQQDGYAYIGGNPADPASWRKL